MGAAGSSATGPLASRGSPLLGAVGCGGGTTFTGGKRLWDAVAADSLGSAMAILSARTTRLAGGRTSRSRSAEGERSRLSDWLPRWFGKAKSFRLGGRLRVLRGRGAPWTSQSTRDGGSTRDPRAAERSMTALYQPIGENAWDCSLPTIGEKDPVVFPCRCQDGDRAWPGEVRSPIQTPAYQTRALR